MAEQLENKTIAYPSTEQEVQLLQQTFKDNERLLKILRSLFLGFETTLEEKQLVKSTFIDPELRRAVRKKIYPIFEKDDSLQIGTVTDYWSGMESQVFGQHPNTINQAIQSKQRVLFMLNTAMSLLENPEAQTVSLTYNPELVVNDELQVGLLARILYIKTITQGLLFIKLTAEAKAEKPSEIKKKQLLDSNQ